MPSCIHSSFRLVCDCPLKSGAKFNNKLRDSISSNIDLYSIF